MACESCNDQTTEGVCNEFINSECVYISEELSCTGVAANTILSSALKRMDEYICQVKNSVTNLVALTNIGGGEYIFKGVNNAGESELKSLISTDGSVNITSNDNTIDFSVIVDIPEVPQATEAEAGIAPIATQEEVDLGENDTKFVTPLKLKNVVDGLETDYTLDYVNGSFILYEGLKEKSTVPFDIPDGIYPTDFRREGNSLIIDLSTGDTLEEDLTELLDFTQIQSDYTEEDSAQVSYIKNRNASKTVFADYVVKETDNTHVIVVDSTEPVVITIPSTLKDKFTVGFIQKSTGLVTIANVDIVPEGLTNTIRGKGHQAFVEKIQGTKFLFGNLNKAT